MAHPTWLAYGFAVLMVSVSVYCIGRLAVAKRGGRFNHTDVNVAHILMGAAMVGMLVPRWKLFPDGVWEGVFAILAVYFLATSVRFVRLHGVEGTDDDDHIHHLSHHLIHMFMSCAMLYMYGLGMPLSTPSASTMSMSGPRVGAGDPGLTLLVIVILFGSAVWQLDGIGQFSPPRLMALSAVGAGGSPSGGDVALSTGGSRPLLAPRLEIACHIAMCVTMGYMLVLMV
jgi:hypothetical protein